MNLDMTSEKPHLVSSVSCTVYFLVHLIKGKS